MILALPRALMHGSRFEPSGDDKTQADYISDEACGWLMRVRWRESHPLLLPRGVVTGGYSFLSGDRRNYTHPGARTTHTRTHTTETRYHAYNYTSHVHDHSLNTSCLCARLVAPSKGRSRRTGGARLASASERRVPHRRRSRTRSWLPSMSRRWARAKSGILAYATDAARVSSPL